MGIDTSTTHADFVGQLTRRDAEDLWRAYSTDRARGINSHVGAVLHGIVLRGMAVERSAQEAAA